MVKPCMLLYSVSSDTTACLWRLVPSGDDGRGLVGVRIARVSSQHCRAITSCAWDPQTRILVTGGLDGTVRLFSIKPSLSGGTNGEASGLDLESFTKPLDSFSTDYEPINAMVLVQGKIVVGCWNGTLCVFRPSMRRGEKVY